MHVARQREICIIDLLDALLWGFIDFNTRAECQSYIHSMPIYFQSVRVFELLCTATYIYLAPLAWPAYARANQTCMEALALDCTSVKLTIVSTFSVLLRSFILSINFDTKHLPMALAAQRRNITAIGIDCTGVKALVPRVHGVTTAVGPVVLLCTRCVWRFVWWTADHSMDNVVLLGGAHVCKGSGICCRIHDTLMNMHLYMYV